MRLTMNIPDRWAIISAELATADSYENQKRTEYLRAALEQDGHHAMPVLGCYEGVKEHSFFVPDIYAWKAEGYGARFEQKAVLTHQGLTILGSNRHPPLPIEKVILSPFRPKGDWTLLQSCGLYLKVIFEGEAP